MKQEHASPFYHAVKDVFKLMLNLDVAVPRQVTNQTAHEEELMVTIELVGDVEGFIRFRFPERTSLEIVKLMCGMEMDKLDAFVTSAMGEMSNIISGNAVTNLARQNYRCDILPPKIVIAEGDTLSVNAELSIPLQTAIGSIKMDMSLAGKETK